MKEKVILVINEGYSDNLGDKAIQRSALSFFNKNDIQVQYSDFTRVNNTEISSNVEESKMGKTKYFRFLLKIIPPKIRWTVLNLKRLLKDAKEKYSLVSIGGGQLILSNETFSIALYLWVNILHYYKNKNIILLCVGVADKFTYFNKFLFLRSLNKINKIYVRDEQSLINLKKIFNIDGEITYDIAFYEKHCSTSYIPQYHLLGVTELSVYNNYNIPVSKNEYYHSWINLLNKNNISLNKDVKLFYTTHGDLCECIEFKKFCMTAFNIDIEILNTNDLDKLNVSLLKARTVISGRMHALILAYNLKIKVISYPISQKLIAFDREIISSKANLQVIRERLTNTKNEILQAYDL